MATVAEQLQARSKEESFAEQCSLGEEELWQR
jgi:hypothetical protein